VIFRWLEEMEAKVDQVKAESKRDHFQQLGRVRDLTEEVAEVRTSTFNQPAWRGRSRISVPKSSSLRGPMMTSFSCCSRTARFPLPLRCREQPP
jgi:hypothetical protein